MSHAHVFRPATVLVTTAVAESEEYTVSRPRIHVLQDAAKYLFGWV
jgi:hypothetical protein